MPLTPEVIDERIKFCRNYEKDNLGIKIGPDFSDIARLLILSKEFEGVALSCSLQGMIPMLGKRNETEAGKDEFLRSMKTATQEPLAMMFYIGYRLGKAEAETSELNRLGSI